MLLIIHTPLSDNEVPSILCGSNQFFSTDSGTNIAVAAYQTPVVTDNSGDDIVADCTPTIGAVLPMGPTYVSCEATDNSGNKATCVFLVHIHVEGKYYFSHLCSPKTELCEICTPNSRTSHHATFLQ